MTTKSPTPSEYTAWQIPGRQPDRRAPSGVRKVDNPLLSRRFRPWNRTTVRFVEPTDPATLTLEVETEERVGVLLTLTRALYHEGLEVIGSRMKIQGRRLVGCFQLAEPDGAAIVNDKRLAVQVAVFKVLDLGFGSMQEAEALARADASA
jgi:hypothetical protein